MCPFGTFELWKLNICDVSRVSHLCVTTERPMKSSMTTSNWPHLNTARFDLHKVNAVIVFTSQIDSFKSKEYYKLHRNLQRWAMIDWSAPGSGGNVTGCEGSHRRPKDLSSSSWWSPPSWRWPSRAGPPGRWSSWGRGSSWRSKGNSMSCFNESKSSILRSWVDSDCLKQPGECSPKPRQEIEERWTERGGERPALTINVIDKVFWNISHQELKKNILIMDVMISNDISTYDIYKWKDFIVLCSNLVMRSFSPPSVPT